MKALPLDTIVLGDNLEVMRTMPAKSVHCCVTSPPYWGQRDYGVEGQLGLERTPAEYVANLVERFGEVWRVLRDDGTLWVVIGDSYAGSWGNYAAPGSTSAKACDKRRKDRYGTFRPPGADRGGSIGCKPKDLVGIPWMVAFALRNNGAANPQAMHIIERVRGALLDEYETWKEVPRRIRREIKRLDAEYASAKEGSWYLRNDIIWAKPNPMPESVTDRCTSSHEHVFHFSKSKSYYYDAEAIAEPCGPVHACGPASRADNDRDPAHGTRKQDSVGKRTYSGFNDRYEATTTRNKRDVWMVPTKPYKGAHYAVYPPDLIRPCIMAGCPQGGIVLDPFMGAGTTAVVARELGCRFVGIELNPEYQRAATKRAAYATNLFAQVTP